MDITRCYPILNPFTALAVMLALLLPLRMPAPDDDAAAGANMHNVASPRTDDTAIEAEIRDRADKAPRVTPADIEAAIASEHYFTAGDGCNGAAWLSVMDDRTGAINAFDASPPPRALSLLTFCVLVLRNGYTVTGESACASPENFDEAIGRKIARQNATNKIWPLLGFRLRDRLATAEDGNFL